MGIAHNKVIIGIDYGSKLAGTTVICAAQDGVLHFFQSTKKQDADKFILDTVELFKPKLIVIDAPLSLPRAYFDDSKDFFYRACDRKLSAMSPMFLGGLTARAIKLKSNLEEQKIRVLEGYPKALVEHLGLKIHYLKKDKTAIPFFLSKLNPSVPIKHNTISNWHQVDALLAWIIAYRATQKKALKIGNSKEGIIYI